jgi:nitroreductase
MKVSEAIRTKRAIRSFDGRPIPKEKIKRILNAGRRAQSAKNMQPWHFIAIEDKGTLEEFSKLGHFSGHLAGAALGVALITPPPEQRFSVMFDTGQAAAYMQLAAWEMGIASCLATIYQPEAARDLLGFPEDLEINVAISFGYPAEDAQSPRPASKQGRRGFTEVVHFEKWQGF